MIHVHADALSVDVSGNPLTLDRDTVTSTFPVAHIHRNTQHDEGNSGSNIPHLNKVLEISSSQPNNSEMEVDTQNLTSIPASCIVTLPTSAQQHQLCATDSTIRTQTNACPPMPCVERATGVYECQWKECNQSFAMVDGLVMHMYREHVHVERPDMDYRCQWRGCTRQGKGFNARYKMLIHLRTHTQERPHKCPICYKCFSRVENLKIHNRSHTGERPYLCPFEGCSKAYSNSSDRFKHIKTHQEQRPFICKQPGCVKRYTDPSSLRKHVRTHGHYFRNDDMSAKGTSYQSFVPVPIDSNAEIDTINSSIRLDNGLPSSDTDLVMSPPSTGTRPNEIATYLLPCSTALAAVIMPVLSTSTPTRIEFSPVPAAIFTVSQRIPNFPDQGSVSCFEYSGVSNGTGNINISGAEGSDILPSAHDLPEVLATTTQCRSTQTEVMTGVTGTMTTMLSVPATNLALRSEAMFPTPILSDDEISSENITQTSSEMKVLAVSQELTYSQEGVISVEQHPLDLSTSPISRHPPISLPSLHGDDIGSGCENSFSSSVGENGKWELPSLNPD